MLFFNTHTHFSKHPGTEILQGHENEPTTHFHSLGIHPWESAHFSLIHEQLIQNGIGNPNCLSIGEVGLDGLKGPAMEIQKAAFIAQINISEEYDMPVIIHCVKAWNELLTLKRILKPQQKWIFHGFAKFGILPSVIQEKMMISIGSAIIHHPKAQEICHLVPNELLLIETDDSSISIQEVYERIAELKEISLQDLTEIVEQNFKNTFQKWHIG